ncbi:hypothetical protein [Leeia speluncae]
MCGGYACHACTNDNYFMFYLIHSFYPIVF